MTRQSAQGRSNLIVVLAVVLAAGVIGAVMVPNTIAAPASLAATGHYVFNGHGKAHGVGLCMSGVYGRAKRDWSYKSIIYYYFENAHVKKRSDLVPNRVRVGIYSGNPNSSISITGNGDFKVRDASDVGRLSFTSGQKATITYSSASNKYTVRRSSDGKTESTTKWMKAVPTSGSTILQCTNIKDGYSKFRGEIWARYSSHSNLMWAINVLNPSYYLWGIVEEPNSWPYEGLKTLMVAARSYVVATAGQGRFEEDHFDVASSTRWQKYEGATQQYLGYAAEQALPRVKSAERKTHDVMLIYGSSQVAKMPYHSCCGGRTDSFYDVWGDTGYPWTVSVRCTLCSRYSSSYSWATSLTKSQLTTKFKAHTASNVGTLVSMQATSYTPGGRVAVLHLHGSSGDKDITGTQMRDFLGLKSSRARLFWRD